MATENLQFNVTANVAGALNQIERFGDGLKKLGREVGQATAALSAMGAVLIREAAKYDRTVKSAVGELQGSFQRLSVEIGRALIPVIKDLTEFVADLVRAWRSLGPETQAQIVSFGALAVKIGAAVAIIGKVGGFVADLAQVAPMLAPGVIVIGAMIVMLSVLYTAWKENWGGMRDVVKETFSGVMSFAGDALSWVVRKISQAFLQVIEFADKAGKFLGIESMQIRPGNVMGTLHEASKAGIDVTPAELGKGLERGFDYGKEAIKEGASFLAHSLKTAFADLKGLFPAGLLQGFGETQGGLGGPMAGLNAKPEKYKGTPLLYDWQTGANRLNRLSIATEKVSQSFAKLEDAANRQAEAKEGLAQAGISRLGAVGEVATSAAAGASAGGPWGAILAVFLDLLSRSKAFTAVIDGLNAIIQSVSDTIGQLLNTFGSIISAIQHITDLSNDSLLPIFDAIGEVWQPIGTFLEGLAAMLKALKPIIDALMKAVAAIIKALVHLIGGVLRIFFEVIRLFAVGVGKVIQGLAWGAEQLLKAIQGWIDAATKMTRMIYSNVPKEYVDILLQNVPDLTPAINSLSGFQKDLNGSLKDLMAVSWEGLEAKTKETAAVKEATKTMEEWTESLTNVPSGYKVRAMQFQAQDAMKEIKNNIITVIISGDMAALVKAVEAADVRSAYVDSGASVSARAAAAGF